MARAPELGSDVHRERHRTVLETAARLICEQGYEAASVQDIADACGLTKAGLYYYIRSKEDLLLEIMSYGMDIFEERVLLPVLAIADPVERLKACMEKNIHLVTEGWSKEVTIILHEHETLTGAARQQINARKKRYVHFLEASFDEAMREGRIRPVEARVAAFSFLGMVLWIYKWFRPDGKIPADQLAAAMQDLFFGGLEIAPAPAKRPRKTGRPARRLPGRKAPGRLAGKVPGRLAGKVPGQLAGKAPGWLSGKAPGQLAGKAPGRLPGKVAGRLAGKAPAPRAGKAAGRAAGKEAGGQARKQEGGQAGKQAGGQTGTGPSAERGQGPPRST